VPQHFLSVPPLYLGDYHRFVQPSFCLNESAQAGIVLRPIDNFSEPIMRIFSVLLISGRQCSWLDAGNEVGAAVADAMGHELNSIQYSAAIVLASTGVRSGGHGAIFPDGPQRVGQLPDTGP
jgi:hypothetical protein